MREWSWLWVASSIKEKFYFSFNYGIKGYSFLAQLTTSLFSLQSIFNFIYSHSIPYLFSFLACPIQWSLLSWKTSVGDRGGRNWCCCCVCLLFSRSVGLGPAQLTHKKRATQHQWRRTLHPRLLFHSLYLVYCSPPAHKPPNESSCSLRENRN